MSRASASRPQEFSRLVIAVLLAAIAGAMMISGGCGFGRPGGGLESPGTVWATITGVIHDENGGPLPQATVTIVETGQLVSPDNGGHFQISGLRAGTYTLAIAVAGYVPTSRYPQLSRDGSWVSPAASRIAPVYTEVGDTVQLRVQVRDAETLSLPTVCFLYRATASLRAVDSVSMPVVSPAPGTTMPRNTEVTIRVRARYQLRSETQGVVTLLLLDENDRPIVSEPGSGASVTVDQGDGEVSLSQAFTTGEHGLWVHPAVALFSGSAETTGVWTASSPYPLAGIPSSIDYPVEAGDLLGFLIPDTKREVMYGLTDKSRLLTIYPNAGLVVQRVIPGNSHTFSLSPEGEYLYFGNGDTNYFYRLDLRTNELLAIPSHRAPYHIVPTGTNLVVYVSGETSDVHVVDINTGTELSRVSVNMVGASRCVAYIPASRSLLMPSQNPYQRILARYRLEPSGQIVWEKDSNLFLSSWVPIADPDGKYFWFGSGRFSVADMSYPAAARLSSDIWTISPDGRYVAFYRSIYDWQAQKSVYTWQEETGLDRRLAGFGPDNSSVWFLEHKSLGDGPWRLRKVTW